MYPMQLRGPQGGYDIVVFERGDVGLFTIILLLIVIILLWLCHRVMQF
nr:E5 BETA [human papillomavirus 84]WBM83398.1 E5 BETA protein [human papillomavirus 84]WBM83820.1 E5 BETA protein [human papillomavirus 84]